MKGFYLEDRTPRKLWEAVRRKLSAFAYPPGIDSLARQNYRIVQIDAVAIGLTNAAMPFVPVFLARLGAGAFEVGLLTMMPAVAGLLFAMAFGRFLDTHGNVVRWFSLSRLLYISAYAATGAAPFLVPRDSLIPAVIGIWAVATIPQTVLNVTFSMVMSSIAGPGGRYELMSRRWTILGFTSAVSVVVVGAMLDWIPFPINYQAAFLALSVGGLISFYFSSHLILPDRKDEQAQEAAARPDTLGGYVRLIRSRPDFLSFTLKRFVYFSGFALAQPILPLYYVRTVQASDAWIGAISMVATIVVLFGYPFWARQSKIRSSRFVLLATTLGAGLYPLLVATTQRVEVIVLLAGAAGVFQAGVDLVFFDELMKRVPEEYCGMFVSFAQTLQYLATMAAPLLGTLLAEKIGLGGALIVASVLRLAGTALFAVKERGVGK